MVAVTAIAASKIKELLENENLTHVGLRMRVIGGGCSGLQYKLEFEQTPDDESTIFESNDIRLFIDIKSAIYLAGAELDYEDGLMGSGFRIKNPNAKNQCGCGESFST